MEGSAANSRRFLLPRSRRLTSDLLHFASKVPMCPHDRIVDLSELIALRKRLPKRISFAALFVRAYGLMAAECPVFRQLHFRWPLANVYEHKETVLMMTIAREFRDEPWVFWGRFQGPENRTLPEIQDQLERYPNRWCEKGLSTAGPAKCVPHLDSSRGLVVEPQHLRPQPRAADGNGFSDDPGKPRC